MDADPTQLYRYAEDLQALMERHAKLEQAHQEALRKLAEDNLDKDQLRNLALHDALTGLPNRRQLEQRLAGQLASAPERRADVYVLYMDLDRFKPVNDELGHDVGDVVLQEVAARLQAVVRRNDMVARVGGDEFVVLLQDIDSRAVVRSIAASVREALQKTIAAGGHEVSIGVSIGCAHSPTDCAEMHRLLKCADTAMYRAKQTGQGFAFFGDDPATQPATWDATPGGDA